MLKMLPKHLKQNKNPRRNPIPILQKYLPLLFLLISFIQISPSSACTEQWTEIDLSQAEWSSIVGDARVKSNEDGSQILEFSRTDTSLTSEIGGAIWNNYDFSQKRGLSISFKPTITMDTSYFGNQKFPQGFAIVITSSSTKDLIGTKAGGISYEGIQNAIAFEFDFYRDSDKSDSKNPHFSAHHNVNGQVSANSYGCSDLCNIPLPNFYDSSLDDFISNIVFEIQIVGKKLTVKSNYGILIDSEDFSAFQELLQQKEVSIGITASMNQNKKVTISQFKVSEIYAKEKGELSLRTTGTVTAGNTVSLYFSLQSTCGELLNVYYDEYTSDLITQLIINGQQVEPESTSFDDSTSEVKMTISENKIGTYTALVKFRGYSSSPIQFTISSGDIQRLEICPSVTVENYKIVSKLEETQDYFIVPLCSYDQYGNPKAISSYSKAKVHYPSNLVPDSVEEYDYSDDRTTIYIQIYISIFGTYEIFSEYFIDEQIRSYELIPRSISQEKSIASVLYDARIIQSDTQSVSLRVQLKDIYGRTIPQNMIKMLNCKFDSSYVLRNEGSTSRTISDLSVTYLNVDNVLLTTKTVSTNGKYLFVPKVQCSGISEVTLQCQTDEVTKENLCEFYKEAGDYRQGSVMAYSDFTDKYTLYGENGDTNPLIISIDEYDNSKLTELMLVDSNYAIKHTKTDVTITAKMDDYTLTVTPVGHKFSISFTSRTSFNPTKDHVLTLGTGLSNIQIPVKFFSKNKHLSNIYLTEDASTKTHIAFYKQDSFTLKAADNILLYDIFEYIEDKTLGKGNELDIKKVKLTIGSTTYDSTSSQAMIIQSGAFISVSSNALTKAGKYGIELTYNSVSIATCEIVIETHDTVALLGDESGKELSSTIIDITRVELMKLTLLDKFNNVLSNKELFSAFATIKTTTSETISIKPNYDGFISIIYKGRDRLASGSIELLNGKIYTIISTGTKDEFSDIDPYKTYARLKSSYDLTANDMASVSLFLLDKYGNKLSTKLEEKDAIVVYAQGKNLKEIVELTTTDQSSTSNGVTYRGIIGIEGEYEIKVFFKNIPIECKGCNFKISALNPTGTSEAYEYMRLYVLGNKKKIPVFNSASKPQIINKQKNLVFYLQFNDRYYNEYTSTKSYSLTIVKDSTKISICQYGNQPEDKGYYTICSEQESLFLKLDDGICSITIESKIFYFYLTNNPTNTTDTTPKEANSMIMQYGNNIYGKTNSPGFFTLDLRNKLNLRIPSIDKSKVSISNSDLNIKVMNGPEPGLLTVFLLASQPGKYSFNVNYDGILMISTVYTYICGCTIKSLSFDSVKYLENGYYAFYNPLDYNGANCITTYSWNELNEKETYANLAINAYQTGDTKKVYKPKVYFNQKNGIVTLFFDNHVTGSLTMKSDVITFDDKSKTLNIPSKVIDKDHFYVSIDSSAKTVNVKLLNDNYEVISTNGLDTKDFKLSILRPLNDDVVTIVKNQAISSEFTFNYDSQLLDAAGGYLFIVYYKGEELSCENCLLEITSNNVDTKNTKVYHKEGDNLYYADSSEYMSHLFKSNFPFFKINLFSAKNNLVKTILSTDTTTLSISLKSGSTTIETGYKNSAQGNIYVYLTEEGRQTYLSQTPMQILTLTITYGSKSYSVDYLLLNNYLEEPTSQEQCYKGADISIINLQSSYIKRAEIDLELEIVLDGCRDNQLQIQNSDQFGIMIDSQKDSVEVIPTDTYGGYILFVKHSTAFSESKNSYITFKEGMSSTFKLTVLPGYAINFSNVKFSNDVSISKPDTDSKFVYVLMDMYDTKGNSITNMGRNLFAYDIFGLKITDSNKNTLPYKISYDFGLKKLKCQIPINGVGAITINTIKNVQYSLTITEGKYYINSLFEYSSNDSNTYMFTLTSRDNYYKQIDSIENPITVTFNYFTISSLNEEVFSKEIEATLESGKYKVTIPSNYPKYQVFGFVPQINSISQICSTCIFKNPLPNVVYTVDNQNYLPHSASRKKFFIKNIDSPLFVFASENTVTAEPTGLNKVELISNSNSGLYIYAFDYSNPYDSVKIVFGTTTSSTTYTLEAAITEYTYVTLAKNEIPAITERYGFNAYSNNKGDLTSISFFMEVRNDQGILVRSTPTLYTSDTESAIDSLNVFNTNIDGVFYVFVSFLNSGKIEYTLKYKADSATEDDVKYNTFQFNEISSFPVDIILFNKKELGSNLIEYDIVATNEDTEEICDERMNIYSTISRLLGNQILYRSGDVCKLLLQFSGDVTLESNIGDFSSELSNTNNNVYTVNPHWSRLVISPNVFNTAQQLKVQFYEKSTLKNQFESDEKTISKQLLVYKVYTPTKYEFVTRMDGLYSSTYTINSNSFNLKAGSVYAFVGSVGDNNISPILIHYSRKKDEDVAGLEAEIIDSKGSSKKIKNLSSKRMNSGNAIELKYPFILRFQLQNSQKVPLDISSTDITRLKTRLIVGGLTAATTEEFTLNFLIRQLNSKTFIAEIPTNEVRTILHAPVVVAKGKNYYIEFLYSSLKFSSYLTYTFNYYQSPNVKTDGRQYAYPNEFSSISNINIYNEKKNLDLYFPFGTETIQTACIYVSQGSGFQVMSGHIDPAKLTISISGSNCVASTMNSYLGCFSFSYSCDTIPATPISLSATYNGITSQTSISTKIFMSSSPSFSGLAVSNSTLESSTVIPLSFIMTAGGSTITDISNNYFDVFVNGEKVGKNKITLSADSQAQNQLRLVIDGSYSYTIPKEKQIMIVYNDGVVIRKFVSSSPQIVTIIQPEYAYSSSSSRFNYKLQVPINLKVGENFYMYLLIKDSNHACYFGDESKLKNIRAKVKILSSDYSSSKLTKTALDGISSCEYIYKLDFLDSSKVSGDFAVTIYDGSNSVSSGEYSIYISPQELDAASSSLNGGSNVKAGDRFEVYFTGTDSYGNALNYFDIADHLEIDFVNESTQRSVEFEKKISAAVDNTKIVISCIIQTVATYEIKLYFNGNELKNFKGLNKITVSYGECSLWGANPQLTDIDGRNTTFYFGEEISINLQCKDQLGNDISSQGSEIFTAYIRLENTTSAIKYERVFSSGKYYFLFTPVENGKYYADISLNGKPYGETLTFEVKTYDYNLYMCMDKRQFNDIKLCDNEAYEKFVESVLGKEYICDKIENGAVFKCNGNCVANTNECKCEGKEYNGYCYPTEMDPFSKIDETKVTCVTTMMTEGLGDFVQCFDGTCRSTEQECDGTKFECPVGYKSCANKCILLNEQCVLTNECAENEVLCWDFTCAEDYSSCPTRISCSNGKVLCPDKTCRESGHCVQPNERHCNEEEYQCADFSCVKNKEDCGKNMVCDPGESLCEDGVCRTECKDVTVPEGKYRCKSGAYVDNMQLCPTEVFQPNDYVKCSSGGISLTKAGCSYVQGGNKITCPESKPILCPDFECVVQSSDCNKNIPTCPTHKPYQCWNNECRTSFDECPTPVTCPDSTPVLCSSGFCAKSKDECQDTSSSSQCPKYRCFDGTCVKSMELCPTHVYCGKDAIKCWNGACVNKITECPSSIFDSNCPTTFPFRCPDGSCRPERKSCSTLSVCPSSIPIKCFDSSCRASINECPSFQSCGEHKVSCPDGTCARPNKASGDLELVIEDWAQCNTPITCYTDKPFLCYDGSCAKELSECPKPPSCTKSQVLCPNGVCASSRQNCKVFEPCESSSPIRCEANTCTESIDQCSTKTKRCPIGYILCPNGECKTSESLCEAFICPKNKPYKCPEGFCVHDKLYCDNQENGCPYNTTHKCPDGTCVNSTKECDNTFDCPESQKKCPDGSCIADKEECPTINGCYADRPFKCSDGTCINPETTTCNLALCPFDKPIQCPNGNCVSKSSECSVEIYSDDKKDCPLEGQIMCVDGRCVPSIDYCRPFYDCDTGYTRCPDGTCRVHSNLCPKSVQCPKTRPYRCSNNICADSEEDCLYGLLCPKGYTRCTYNGKCTLESAGCTEPNEMKSGCKEGGVKCPNGRCLSEIEKCKTASNACPDDSMPYLCSNGECVDDKSSCPSISPKSVNEVCEEGKVLCPSGRCVKDDNNYKRTQCTNNIGCPLHKPYRCSNGECVSSKNDCTPNSFYQGQIISNIYCDPSKPYFCDDKSCVSDYTFCKTSTPCVGPSMIKCVNGFCINEEVTSCEKYMSFCPIASPIQCPNGNCVSNIIDCDLSFNVPTCNDGEFYCTRLAKCVTNKLDCFIYYDNSQIVKNSVNRRLTENFDNFVNPLKDKTYQKNSKSGEFVSLIEEDSKVEEEKEGVLCYDGTVAGPGENCPIVPACKMGQYRCENGGCSYSKDNCHSETNYICPEGQMKCPDGFCHEDCKVVAYHGCLVGQYQCSNGLCVNDEYDCIGYSMCKDPESPFRCIDGTCKSSPSECPLIKRLGEIQNMTYTFNRINKIAFSFALDHNKRTLASIEIPGNGLSVNKSKSDAYGRLYIEEVSSSILYDSNLYNNSASFLFNVSNSVIGSEGVLTFENSIMSPVFKFYTKDKGVDFSMTGVINIIHNYYEASGINYTDYCLAKLEGTGEVEERHWKCVQRKEDEEQTDFRINEFGIYAVILNPLRNKINYSDSEYMNFFLENVKVILIVFGAIIVVIALVSYIFFRVTRYREKYHENRTKILLLKQQREEYENMTTDIFGQTLGDNINGIVYKSNPCYSVTDEIKTRDTSLEEEIENLQIQCKNMTDQNNRLQADIDELTEKYKILSNSIENMSK